MNILENKHLIIESKNSGAELTRIYSKNKNLEFLWNADNKYWGRHSPILFPIVGKLLDNKTIIENNTYNMSQHGFARDLDFKVLEVNENSISYILKSNEDTKKIYPYSFELIIKYTLFDSSVNVEWTVNNTDSKEMLFSIGAHPAFNLPLSDSERLDDYYLKFKYNNKVNKIILNGPYSDEKIPVNILDDISLSPELFINDALIYTNIDEISILSKTNDNFIKVNFEDFPLVGIWTPYYKDTNSTAPFICIEPWFGLADNINSNYEFKNKDYINKLNIGSSFTTSYTISVG